ncbi:hypothetical protein OGATHE_005999 [Ogataea polymorpha]|uniref:Uncharacterized protein n=1 Tax=Ogataea polymorpha TaxID=460523 RepID=A0A9P8NVS4_9ASCO|nr:hypothetical protein OGATHE_005999 [Ogataea polymorpha]
MKSSVASSPLTIKIDWAPPGWSSRYELPSNTWPLTANHGSVSLSLCASNSEYLITTSIFSRLHIISRSSSICGLLSACLTVSSTSPQLLSRISPPSALTLSIQPPGLLATTGCSNRRVSPSRIMATRYHQLFSMDVTFQYIVRG